MSLRVLGDIGGYGTSYSVHIPRNYWRRVWGLVMVLLTVWVFLGTAGGGSGVLDQPFNKVLIWEACGGH